MQAVSLSTPQTSLRKTIAEFIIEFLKIELAVKPLQRKYGPEHFLAEMEYFKTLAPGTVGHDFVKLLEETGLAPIPKHESHDLWHILTGHGMTSEEEIRMQAFMYGNGSRSVFCILFLSSGILLPSAWPMFYKDYKRGKNSEPVLGLNILEHCERKTAELRMKIR
jgi:ubiquinone biosynthesis protein Coq4